MDFVEFVRSYNARVTLLNRKLWVIHADIGVSAYDFEFDAAFDCSHPFQVTPGPAILRVGAIQNYALAHATLANEGLDLIESVDQYEFSTRAPELVPRSSRLHSAKRLVRRAALFRNHLQRVRLARLRQRETPNQSSRRGEHRTFR